MIYVDTNLIVSYIDEADPNHEKAVELIKTLEGRRVVSRLTLVELASVFSRARLEEPIALALYSIRSVKADIVQVDFNKLLNQAVKYAPILRLRTLDLLHLVASLLTECRKFATLDTDIIKKSDIISKTLGIEILTPKKT
ncbi:MAG: type II toxin-antitoxin system VapC family toxin [Ignisphaera sp.]